MDEIEIINKTILTCKNLKNLKNKILTSLNSFDIPQDNLKILMLNTPCHGFGDIIFAIKISNYIRKWYNIDVKIATTKVKEFISLGENPQNLYTLETNRQDCRRFKNLRFSEKIPKFDLIFVTPLQADFNISKNDIKSLIDYSDNFNTYFFSEYNDLISKNFDFPTGIGSKRLGLFLTDIKQDNQKSEKISSIFNPYALCYIAESIVRAKKCYMSFFLMISKKYSKIHNNFEIITPKWIVLEILKDKKILREFYQYFSTIFLIDDNKTKTKITQKTLKNNNILTIRGDIFPIPNKDMLYLIKNSVDDILLTGDQSITDALSCCYDKNIWYQIAPWKENFGKELAKLLPQKYFKKKQTSCGTIKAINYKSNFRKFVNTWDFRKLGKEKLDNVIKLATFRKNNSNINNIIKIINSSKTLKSLKNKIL